MKPQTIIILLIICFAFIGLLIWGYNSNGNTAANVQGVAANAAASALTAGETLYDFGSISMKDGKVSKDFVLTNSADQDVTIRGVETSCMCTAALLVESDGSTKGPFGMPGMGGMTGTNDVVKAGGTKTLRVIYDPNAHGPAGVGEIDRFITVTDSAGGVLKLEIRAVVTP